MDITNYFRPSEGDKLQVLVLSAAKEINNLEEREEV